MVAHTPAGKGKAYLQRLIAKQIRADVEDDIASSDFDNDIVDEDGDTSIATAATSEGGSICGDPNARARCDCDDSDAH